MFKKISASIQYPHWVSQCPRFRRLDLLDKLLDGRFYDHLPYAFFDETDTTGGPIPLEKRRPSAQWKFANQVASYCSRKLFAGNHAPRVMHKDDATRKLILRLLRKAKWMTTMLEAAKLGSVGSIAVTFRVERRDDGTLHIGTNCWRSKYCDPSFDTMGELTSLRLQYVTTGAWLDALGAPPPRDGEKIDRGGKYWFIRDYGQMNEVTYRPVKEADWNPIDGFLGEPMRQLLPWTVIEHGLGFVPGHWFKNLVGGCEPDGDCTFEPGVDNSIEHDYTLSQIGRGIRYNAAPTLVVKGNFVNCSTNNNSFNTANGTMVFGAAGSLTTNTFEVAGRNLGTNFAGFNNNFAVGTLNITNGIRFVDYVNNGGGGNSNEVLYVDVLHLFSGSTMKLSALTIYVGVAFIDEDSTGSKTFNGGVINQGNAASLGLLNVSMDNGGQIVFVPEPGTWALLALGLGSVAARRTTRGRILG